MAEIRRGFGDEGQDSQRLPWLEPVEDDEYYPEPRSSGWRKWAVIGFGVLAVLVVASVMLRGWHAQRSDIGTLIKADPAPYKVRPSDPGGLKVDSNDRIAQRTGVGSDINSPLDLAAIPEEPIVGAGAPAAPRPATPTDAAKPAPTAGRPSAKQVLPKAPVAVAEPVATAPAVPTPAPTTATGGGATVQLGAFSSEAKARSAWKTLSKRFSYLAPLTPVILPVKSGDATLYRLRATGGPAGSICARMKIAGEACAVAN
jgi:cell division septation protein DedD